MIIPNHFLQIFYSVFSFFCWLTLQMEARKSRIDPFAENDLWESLKNNRIQKEVLKNEKGEINQPPNNIEYLKVVCISDTHEQLHNVTVPDGDVLIHAGDFTNNGKKEEIEKFNEEMAKFPHKYKLVVAGNHELGFDPDEKKEQRNQQDIGVGTENGFNLLTNVTYLQDKEIIIDGIKFFGSSYHPLYGFPFYRSRASQLAECWKAIPNDTDILITHTPPLGYLDQFGDERWGCKDLLFAVERIKPKYHIFGHVHEKHGALTNHQTTFINAAQCTRSNIIKSRPIIFYIPKKNI